MKLNRRALTHILVIGILTNPLLANTSFAGTITEAIGTLFRGASDEDGEAAARAEAARAALTETGENAAKKDALEGPSVAAQAARDALVENARINQVDSIFKNTGGMFKDFMKDPLNSNRQKTVGQEDSLRRILTGLSDQNVDLVAIEGNSGLGKTQLIAEAANSISRGEVAAIDKTTAIIEVNTNDARLANPQELNKNLSAMIDEMKTPYLTKTVNKPSLTKAAKKEVQEAVRIPQLIVYIPYPRLFTADYSQSGAVADLLAFKSELERQLEAKNTKVGRIILLTEGSKPLIDKLAVRYPEPFQIGRIKVKKPTQNEILEILRDFVDDIGKTKAAYSISGNSSEDLKPTFSDDVLLKIAGLAKYMNDGSPKAEIRLIEGAINEHAQEVLLKTSPFSALKRAELKELEKNLETAKPLAESYKYARQLVAQLPEKIAEKETEIEAADQALNQLKQNKLDFDNFIKSDLSKLTREQIQNQLRAKSGALSSITINDVALYLHDTFEIDMDDILHPESEQTTRQVAEKMNRVIFGQRQALDVLSDMVDEARSDLKGEGPVQPRLVVGEKGGGKSDAAKRLAKVTKRPFIEETFADKGEKHTVSTLFGAPPGYVGSDQPEGTLVGRLRANTNAVVRFDEMDKAHEDFYKALLNMFQDGIIRDRSGRDARVSDILFIMTSNGVTKKEDLLAMAQMSEEDQKKFYQQKMFELKGFWIPDEFMSRVKMVVYLPLDNDALQSIVTRQLTEMNEQLEAKIVHVEMSDSVKGLLANIAETRFAGNGRDQVKVYESVIASQVSSAMKSGIYNSKFYDATGALQSIERRVIDQNGVDAVIRRGDLIRISLDDSTGQIVFSVDRSPGI